MIREAEAISLEEIYTLQSFALWEIRIAMDFSIVEVGFLFIYIFDIFSVLLIRIYRKLYGCGLNV